MGMDRFAPGKGVSQGYSLPPSGVFPGLSGVLDRARAGSSLKEQKSDTLPSRVGSSRAGYLLSCSGGKPYRCQKCLGCLRSQAKTEQAAIGLVVDATANSWFVTRTISEVGLRRVKAAVADAGLAETPRNIDRVFRKIVISPALKRLRSVLARRHGYAVKLHAWSKAELGGKTNRFHVHMVLSCDEVVTKEQIKSALMGKGADGTLRGFGGFTDCRALKSLRPAVQARLSRLGRADGKGVALYLSGYVNKQLGVFRPYRTDHYGQVAVDRFADAAFLAEEFASVFRSAMQPDYPVLRASGRYVPRKLAKPLWRRVHRLAYEAFNGAGSFSAVEQHEAAARAELAKLRRKLAAFDEKIARQKKGLNMPVDDLNLPLVDCVPPHWLHVSIRRDAEKRVLWHVYADPFGDVLRFHRVAPDGSDLPQVAAPRHVGMPHVGRFASRPSWIAPERWEDVKPPPSPEAAADRSKSLAWLASREPPPSGSYSPGDPGQFPSAAALADAKAYLKEVMPQAVSGSVGPPTAYAPVAHHVSWEETLPGGWFWNGTEWIVKPLDGRRLDA